MCVCSTNLGFSVRSANCSAGSPTTVAVLERARRDHQFTRETTLRRRQRLIFDQRRVEEAEREAAAAMTRAEWVVGRSARARDSVAAATPPPPARVQHVHSRSGGFQACYTVVPSPSTHQPTYAVPNPFTHHMSPTYLSTHVPVLIPEVCDQIMV